MSSLVRPASIMKIARRDTRYAKIPNAVVWMGSNHLVMSALLANQFLILIFGLPGLICLILEEYHCKYGDPLIYASKWERSLHVHSLWFVSSRLRVLHLSKLNYLASIGANAVIVVLFLETNLLDQRLYALLDSFYLMELAGICARGCFVLRKIMSMEYPRVYAYYKRTIPRCVLSVAMPEACLRLVPSRWQMLSIDSAGLRMWGARPVHW